MTMDSAIALVESDRRTGRLRGWRETMVSSMLAVLSRLPETRASRALARRLVRFGPQWRVVRRKGERSPDSEVLLVTHDLSLSGAPKIVLQLAEILVDAGRGVTVVSPQDGPLASAFASCGANLMIDPRAFAPESHTLSTLAGAANAAFCNTIVARGAVRHLHGALRTVWYLHEVSLIEELLASDPTLGTDLALPDALWCGSELSASLVRPHRVDVEVVPYGLVPLMPCTGDTTKDPADARVRIAVFGSLESRKGQDLAVEAVRLLPASIRDAIALTLYGRTLDAAFRTGLVASMTDLPVSLGGELDTDGYRQALLRTDVVLVPSRDDTLPLVSLDALGARRVLACTATTGTAAYLRDGVDAFVAPAPTAASIATMLERAVRARADWNRIGECGRAVFDQAFSARQFAARVLATVGDTART